MREKVEMSELPSRGHGPPPPDNKRDADVLPFKLRGGEDEINPEELSPAEIVSFFISTWNHPSTATHKLAGLILEDTTKTEETNAWQARLQQVINDSPLLDHYDEIIDADPVALLLDTSARANPLPDERKAFRKLIFMRAAEVIEQPDQDPDPQLARLPLRDEYVWESLNERLAKEL